MHSRSRRRLTGAHGASMGSGVHVVSPHGCPAVSRGRRELFTPVAFASRRACFGLAVVWRVVTAAPGGTGFVSSVAEGYRTISTNPGLGPTVRTRFPSSIDNAPRHSSDNFGFISNFARSPSGTSQNQNLHALHVLHGYQKRFCNYLLTVQSAQSSNANGLRASEELDVTVTFSKCTASAWRT